MLWTVVWKGGVRDRLAEIWVEETGRDAIRTAADCIDQILRSSPLEAGEEFFGDRILVELPLAVVYSVSPADRRVEVLNIAYSRDKRWM